MTKNRKSEKNASKKSTLKKKNDEHAEDMVLLQAWIPRDLYEWVRTVAKADDRAMAQWIRHKLTKLREDPKLLSEVL